MSDVRPENVGRGAALAALAIPAALTLGLAPVPLEWQGIYWVVVVVALPWLTRLLYLRGSGGFLAMGRRQLVVVTVVALAVSLIGSVLTVAYQVYRQVGGAGGPLDPGFLEVLGLSFTTNMYFGYGTVEDLIFGAVVATTVGGASLAVAVVTAPRPPLVRVAPN